MHDTKHKPGAETLKKPGQKSWKTLLRKNWPFLLMLLIPTVYFLLFCYWPMFGISMAFQDYKVGTPFLSGNTQWVGLKWFKQL